MVRAGPGLSCQRRLRPVRADPLPPAPFSSPQGLWRQRGSPLKQAGLSALSSAPSTAAAASRASGWAGEGAGGHGEMSSGRGSLTGPPAAEQEAKASGAGRPPRARRAPRFLRAGKLQRKPRLCSLLPESSRRELPRASRPRSALWPGRQLVVLTLKHPRSLLPTRRKVELPWVQLRVDVVFRCLRPPCSSFLSRLAGANVFHPSASRRRAARAAGTLPGPRCGGTGRKTPPASLSHPPASLWIAQPRHRGPSLPWLPVSPAWDGASFWAGG